MDDRLALFRIGLALSARIERRQARARARADVQSRELDALRARSSLWKSDLRRDVSARRASVRVARDLDSTPDAAGTTPSARPVYEPQSRG